MLAFVWLLMSTSDQLGPLDTVLQNDRIWTNIIRRATDHLAAPNGGYSRGMDGIPVTVCYGSRSALASAGTTTVIMSRPQPSLVQSSEEVRVTAGPAAASRTSRRKSDGSMGRSSQSWTALPPRW
jgi:hypothetical protein